MTMEDQQHEETRIRRAVARPTSATLPSALRFGLHIQHE
jgi:hypothetical protein